MGGSKSRGRSGERMRDRLRTLLIRSAFLFLLSLVLVAGFWFHREFYQIGFANLLIIGGGVTFLVIWAARLALSRGFPRGRARGGVAFSLAEGGRLLKGLAGRRVRPAEGTSVPGVGYTVRAKYEAGPEFGRLLIEDARRAYVADLTEEDARQAGFRSAAELRNAGNARWGWRPSDVVTVMRVHPRGVGR